MKSFELKNSIAKDCKTNKAKINLNENEISILLDELTFLFTSQGIEKNDEPNSFGLFVEELIDTFSQ